jgi:hypothetical protein
MDRSSVSGRVWLVPEAWGGFAGTEDTAGEWGDRSSSQGGRCTEGSLPITPTSRSDTRSSGPPLEAPWRCRRSLSQAMITPFRDRANIAGWRNTSTPRF